MTPPCDECGKRETCDHPCPKLRAELPGIDDGRLRDTRRRRVPVVSLNSINAEHEEMRRPTPRNFVEAGLAAPLRRMPVQDIIARNKAILLLYDGDDLTTRDIAEAFHLRDSSVRCIVHRERRRYEASQRNATE